MSSTAVRISPSSSLGDGEPAADALGSAPDGGRCGACAGCGGHEDALGGVTTSVPDAALEDTAAAPTTDGSVVGPSFATLVEFAGDDPLGLLGNGWDRIERQTVDYQFLRPLCPPQETYASFTGTPVLVDTYRSPLDDGVEVDVSLIEITDPAVRSELVVAAFDELTAST